MSPVPGSSSSSMPAFVLDALRQSDSNNSSSTYSNNAFNSYSSSGLGSGGNAGGAGGAAARGVGVGSVGELVSCLMALDALGDAKLYLLLHARAGVRQMLLR